VNRVYLERGDLEVEKLGRGFAWLDTGTHQSLMDAGTYVRVVEDRQGTKICCPEEIAWRMGFISAQQLEKLAQPLLKSGYGEYLLDVLKHEAP
jgi:glucose-1-phosphate thymidylyltransferase